MSGAPLRVAVLGAGTVGREVVCALLERTAELRPSDGVALVLTGVAVRDVARAVERGLPAELLTDAPAHLVAGDEADVIVELMGGDEPAHTLIAAALSMGKSVVTANKHVIAHCFCPVCGIHPYGLGTDPKGNKIAAINIRCLTDIDLDAVPVTHYDGRSK